MVKVAVMQDKRPQAFRRVADVIENRILGGAYPPDRPLPSIRELASEQKVAAMTVQRALKALACSGRVRSVPRVGVFPASGCPLDAVAFVTDEDSLTESLDPMAHMRTTILDVLAGAKRACTDAGIHLITVTEHDDPQKLLKRRTGFLLHFSDYQLSALTRWTATLLLAKEPCVAISYDNGLPNFVDRDVPGAYEKGLRYLYGLGHRNVLLVTRPIAETVPALPSLSGMPDLKVRRHVSVGQPEAAVQQEIARLIPTLFTGAPAQRVTAVLAGPGNMARPSLAALEAAGVDVPGDCSLLGFCSAQHAQLEGRRISHIDNAWRAIAGRAVQELLRIAATGQDIGHVRVMPELAEGDTCAPPAHRFKGRRWDPSGKTLYACGAT